MRCFKLAIKPYIAPVLGESSGGYANKRSSRVLPLIKRR